MTTETPAPPPPPASPPPPPPPSPAIEASWRDGLPEELRVDATLSKFDGIEALARSHLDLKRQFSADKIVLPKGDEDADGWNSVFTALGRPATPEDYKFPTVKDGEENPLAKAFAPVAHELGLNQRQAEGLDNFLDKFTSDAVTAAETAAGEAEQTLRTSLIEKHGEAGWKAMEARAKSAAEALLPAGEEGGDMADRIGKIIGDAALIEFFDGLGKKLGEGRFLGGDPVDPQVEKDPVAQRAALQADEDFRAKLDRNEPAALSKWKAVNAAIANQKNGA